VDKLDSLRYHALGNAVTVPVAEWLAERVKAYLERQHSPAVELPVAELASVGGR
jgi:DNA (cytosine-5)-methyltransferase 1